METIETTKLKSTETRCLPGSGAKNLMCQIIPNRKRTVSIASTDGKRVESTRRQVLLIPFQLSLIVSRVRRICEIIN
jgi:hypothetical protein